MRRDFHLGRRQHPSAELVRRSGASRGQRTRARTEALHRDLGGLQVAPQSCGAAAERRGNPKPKTDGLKKSYPSMAALRPANKGRQRPAELAEPRDGAEENPGSQNTRRAQKRASVSRAADRIRQAAKRNPDERPVALLHHVAVSELAEAFHSLKSNFAAGMGAASGAPAGRCATRPECRLRGHGPATAWAWDAHPWCRCTSPRTACRGRPAFRAERPAIVRGNSLSKVIFPQTPAGMRNPRHTNAAGARRVLVEERLLLLGSEGTDHATAVCVVHGSETTCNGGRIDIIAV